MNIWITYGIIAAILLVAELIYFRIADKCNIIDKPNERSSHSTIVLRVGESYSSLVHGYGACSLECSIRGFWWR